MARCPLAPFLPPHLVRALADGAPSRLPHVDRLAAALLFSDISGFTALTERLQARGREGAEEIAAAIDAAFAPAIEAIEEHGGSIVSFGGDALFTIFGGPAAVARAVAAARAIRQRFRVRGAIATSGGPVRLGISQAIHHGRVQGLHLGTGPSRHYLVAGAAVQALARLQSQASAGQVLLSPAARALERKPHDAAWRVRMGPVRASTLQLAPYLPARLLPSLRRFEGEYRRVAVLFLETAPASPATLNAFFSLLASVLDRYEGLLLKTDLSSAGNKWMCLFGVPQAHEDDPDRAALAALDVRTMAPEGLRLRGGLHGGVVAHIMVGSRSRRAVDVMGDAVNTAARALTRASWGEILVTAQTRKVLARVEAQARGAHLVKGKSRPLELAALAARTTGPRQSRTMAPLIGRDAELRQIVAALERAACGGGAAIGIKGDAGAGKSRLKHEAARAAREMGFGVHEGRAPSFGAMAYATVGALLRDALGLREAPDEAEVLAAVSLAAARLDLQPVDRRHLASVLGASRPDAAMQGLEPSAVRLNALIAVRSLCQALARDRPRLLVLEDMHWADRASVEAAAWLSRAAGEAGYLLLLLYRPGYERPDGVAEMALHDLDPAAVDELLVAHLGIAPEGVSRLVRERAGGNPLYVEEMVRHLLEDGFLGMSDKGYEIVRQVRSEDVPDGIESLIAARLDRLSPDARSLARSASVVGRSFDLRRLPGAPCGPRSRALRELVSAASSGLCIAARDASWSSAMR